MGEESPEVTTTPQEHHTRLHRAVQAFNNNNNDNNK